MKLEKRIQKDWASVQKRADSMFKVYTNEIGKMIEAAGKDIVGTVAALLSMHPEVSYKTLKQAQTIERLSQAIHRRCEVLAQDIEIYWKMQRADFDILSRLSMNFIATKTSPPWIKKTLDLESKPKDGRFDPGKGHLRFYFFNMADAIVKQVSQGALKEETLNQILGRVRAMFNRKELKGVRENRFDPYSLRHDVDVSEQGDYEEALRGAVDIKEGTYTLEDVSYFQDNQRRAMNWESRDYRPWFSDEVKRNNRYLRDLEQVLMSDAIDLMHSGQLQQQLGYPESMGIQDFQWVVSRPQPTCDECTKRDGLTMKQIKSKIDDDFGTQPPPLHPNCVIGSTKVSAAGVSKKFDRWFSGKVITISVEGYDDLTITMNHPVLTDRGWVRSGDLKQTDKLVASRSDDGIVKTLDPNNHHVKTTIQDLSDSFLVSDHVLGMAVPGSSKDFHGDGSVDHKVHIEFLDGKLPDNIILPGFKLFEKRSLRFWHQWRTFLNAFSFKAQAFMRSLHASYGIMSILGPSLPLLFARSAHSVEHGFSAIPYFKTSSNEAGPDSSARASDSPSNIHARLSGHIKFVEIKNLIVSEFSGHVYNLETTDGYYVANGIIVHNCRCQLVPKISEDWAKSSLKDGDQEWDPETGIVYRADKQEKDAGFTDMTLDEYLASVPSGVG